MSPDHSKITLTELARKAMLDQDFIPDFSFAVQEQLHRIKDTEKKGEALSLLDLSHKLWFSIDNEDSRDLDQLTYTESTPDGQEKIFIAIADVDAFVKKDTPIDEHARSNTTSVYTPTVVFSMLPEMLSTDLTSLNENERRQAIVVEIEILEEGSFGSFNVYRAWVKNWAKLDYLLVGQWLEDPASHHPRIASLPELADQILRQDKIAQRIKYYRHSQGMLTFERREAKPIIRNQEVIGLKEIKKNRARELIEFFMISANYATTKFLGVHHFPIFRRVVRNPKRWNRIVELAEQLGEKLPDTPHSLALEKFLLKQKKENPDHFSALSLSVVKLIGKGEYAIQLPGEEPLVHFGLSLREYSHSTAPNRRFPDLIVQRLIKDVLAHKESSYSETELKALALHCTQKENEAGKIQRQLDKSAAAIWLFSQIGKEFDSIVTGTSSKGVFVKIDHPPIEGKLIEGFHNVDVGCCFKVKLIKVDVANGHIDFARTSASHCL